MSKRICKNGHSFDKTSACPVCPICSSEEMNEKFATEFPKLSAPAFRALDHARVTTLKDLTKFTKKELLALHGFGPKALRLLSETLRKHDLSLKSED